MTLETIEKLGPTTTMCFYKSKSASTRKSRSISAKQLSIDNGVVSIKAHSRSYGRLNEIPNYKGVRNYAPDGGVPHFVSARTMRLPFYYPLQLYRYAKW